MCLRKKEQAMFIYVHFKNDKIVLLSRDLRLTMVTLCHLICLAIRTTTTTTTACSVFKFLLHDPWIRNKIRSDGSNFCCNEKKPPTIPKSFVFIPKRRYFGTCLPTFCLGRSANMANARVVVPSIFFCFGRS